jgi:hypothetical protein
MPAPTQMAEGRRAGGVVGSEREAWLDEVLDVGAHERPGVLVRRGDVGMAALLG